MLQKVRTPDLPFFRRHLPFAVNGAADVVTARFRRLNSGQSGGEVLHARMMVAGINVFISRDAEEKCAVTAFESGLQFAGPSRHQLNIEFFQFDGGIVHHDCHLIGTFRHFGKVRQLPMNIRMGMPLGRRRIGGHTENPISQNRTQFIEQR